MNEAAWEPVEYRVGGTTTRVRFMNRDEVFRGIDDGGGRIEVFDTNTRAVVEGSFPGAVVLPAGEAHKSWPSVEAILRAALDRGLGRDGVLVGCGGGVVCDIAAFAGSIYMRGCRLLLVPTTLLAMVDAAFGGKTGIDFSGLKNMVGTFYPAEELRIAVDFLPSLPYRDYHSGLAEVLKHALLDRSTLRGRLEQQRPAVLARDLDLLREIVSDALAVKAGIVAKDFRENGSRAHLNLGHTFGHALESVTGFQRYTHGEAVAWGIDKAMKLGARLGLTDAGYAREVSALLAFYEFELGQSPAAAETILKVMRQDKKKRDGRVRFVLQREWGETVVREVDDDLVLSVLRE